MNRIKFIPIIFCCFWCVWLFAQVSNYTIKKDSLLHDFYTAETNQEKINKLKEVIIYTTSNNKILDVSKYSDNLIIISKQSNDLDTLAWTYLNKGNYYIEIDYNKALSYYHKALDLYFEINNAEGKGDVYMCLGNLFDIKGMYEKALKSHNRAIILFKESNSSKLGMAYYNLAQVFINTQQYTKANDYLLKAINYDTNKLNLVKLAKCHLLKNNLKQGEYINTINGYINYLKIYPKICELRKLFIYSEIALCYAYLKMYEEANSFIKNVNIEAIKKATKGRSHALSKEIIANLCLIFELNGDYKKAYALLKYKEIVVNEFITEKKESIFNKMNILHRIKENELSLLREQKNNVLISSDLAKKKELLTFISIITILIILILAGTIFYIKKLKNQSKVIKKQKEGLQKGLDEVLLLTGELNHRVKNNLQIISSIITLSIYNIKDLSLKFSLKGVQSRIESIALLHEELSISGSVSKVNIKKYLTSIATIISTTYKISNKDIKLNLDIDDFEFNTNTSVTLGMLINELMTNSFKYAFIDNCKETIEIRLKCHDFFFNLTYSDADTGYDFSKNQSIGSKLISHFSDKLNGVVHNKIQNSRYVFCLKFNPNE